MATWHQSRRPVCWIHPTQWTVVTDPPGEFASGRLFTTEDAARAFLATAGTHSYIVKPLSSLHGTEATHLGGKRWAIRPVGCCGTCGWTTDGRAWTVVYVNAASPHQAVYKAGSKVWQ